MCACVRARACSHPRVRACVRGCVPREACWGRSCPTCCWCWVCPSSPAACVTKPATSTAPPHRPPLPLLLPIMIYLPPPTHPLFLFLSHPPLSLTPSLSLSRHMRAHAYTRTHTHTRICARPNMCTPMCMCEGGAREGKSRHHAVCIWAGDACVCLSVFVFVCLSIFTCVPACVRVCLGACQGESSRGGARV